jgi:ABC-type Fe3+-hydroxamate transport system substrate-binding protein
MLPVPRAAVQDRHVQIPPAARTDDQGREFGGEQVRSVVSLVPSLTESVAVTAPELLVGATDWCVEPAGLDVTRVGGTKSPDVDTVIALRPDVVLANEEENREPDLARMRAAGLEVWVTAPRTVPESLDSLTRMMTLVGHPSPEWLTAATGAWAGREPGPGRTAAVAIWRRPWMWLGRDTFAGDLLARLGLANLLADRTERYPRVDVAEVLDLQPDLVVLPDEPYRFTADDGPEAFPGRPVALVSGRHLTWYGPSLVQAPDVLLAQLADAGTAQR